MPVIPLRPRSLRCSCLEIRRDDADPQTFRLVFGTEPNARELWVSAEQLEHFGKAAPLMVGNSQDRNKEAT